MRAEWRQAGPGHWQLIGSVGLETVSGLLALPEADGDRLRIDWSRVDALDSTAVALMIEWLRQARRAGIELRFTGRPPALDNLLEVFDLRTPLADLLA